MGSSQTARRSTHDRTRRHPLIRPDYLQLYKVKEPTPVSHRFPMRR